MNENEIYALIFGIVTVGYLVIGSLYHWSLTKDID